MFSHLNLSRDELFYAARVAEQAERYDEMVEFVTEGARKSTAELSVRERALFATAFKFRIGTRRASWRIVASNAHRERRVAPRGHMLPLVSRYQEKIEREITSACYDALEVIDTALLPITSSSEGRIFFLKMEGDCFRYLAEITPSEDSEDTRSTNARKAYEEALQLAEQTLKPFDSLRLALALNYAVFLHEVMRDAQAAYDVASQASEEAMQDIDDMDDETYMEVTRILRHIKENIDLWSYELSTAQA